MRPFRTSSQARQNVRSERLLSAELKHSFVLAHGFPQGLPLL